MWNSKRMSFITSCRITRAASRKGSTWGISLPLESPIAALDFSNTSSYEFFVCLKKKYIYSSILFLAILRFKVRTAKSMNGMSTKKTYVVA